MFKCRGARWEKPEDVVSSQERAVKERWRERGWCGL